MLNPGPQTWSESGLAFYGSTPNLGPTFTPDLRLLSIYRPLCYVSNLIDLVDALAFAIFLPIPVLYLQISSTIDPASLF